MKMKNEGDKIIQGHTKIHNAYFYNLTPRSISCLTYCKKFARLALFRNDGSLEIWNMQDLPFREKTTHTTDKTIEDMAWLGERLFTVGLSGELTEWNLKNLTKKCTQLATGNGIWCLDVHPDGTELAIGTDEGYINIFDVSDGQMLYKNLFDKQEGRIICCQFHTSGNFLVTGSSNVIRVWCTKMGQAIHRMSVGRKEKHTDTIVWSVRVLRDFTILAGDSRGCITVWDGKTAAQIESHQVLKADVLAVEVNEDENLLICSGIEPNIRIYAKTVITREYVTLSRWVRYLQRSAHDHDVNALACAGDKIISGGVDGYLTISMLEKSHQNIVKYGSFLSGQCAGIAAEKRLLLLRYSDYLEVWRLGIRSDKNATDNADNKDGHSRILYSLDCGPEKLLEMKSNHGEIIICNAISPNGKLLAYSTQSDIRLFTFAPGSNGQISQLKRVKHLPERFTVATKVIFQSDSTRIFLVKSDNTCDIFAILSNGDIDYMETIKANKFVKEPIHLLSVSQNGSYLIAAGTCRTISVWTKREDNHFKHHINVPRYTAQVTAIAIHPTLPWLVVTFSDGKIFEYDIEEMCFTCTDFFKPETHCISGILLDARNPDIIILHNEANLFVMEKLKINTDKNCSSKKLKVVKDIKVLGLGLKLTKPYEHLIQVLLLNSCEMVAVGVNPVSFMEQLPDAFRQKKFGRM